MLPRLRCEGESSWWPRRINGSAQHLIRSTPPLLTGLILNFEALLSRIFRSIYRSVSLDYHLDRARAIALFFALALLTSACTSEQRERAPSTKAQEFDAGAPRSNAARAPTADAAVAPDTSAPGDADAGVHCAADSCDTDAAERCRDGVAARCSVAADGCGTWQTIASCAHGCGDQGTHCATEPTATRADAGASVMPAVPDVGSLHLSTRALAAQVGYYATAAPGQMGALTGADLGWTFRHRDKLWVMFGDSWYLDPVNLASNPDDALGQIALTDFPDGASVEAFVHAHPAAMGRPSWQAAAPTMSVFLNGGSGPDFAPVISQRDGKMLRSGIGFVPMTGFSNGRDDGGEGVFAVFFNFEHVECVSGSCSDGYACDQDLGVDSRSELNPPCVVGSSQSCTRGPGYCQDRSTSIYDSSSNDSRALSVVLRHQVGVTTPDDPLHFKTQPWETQRFFNMTSRTVTDFDPARSGGDGNDYTPALGNDLPRSGVLMWGRPQFGGIGSEGRDAQLYLAWVAMPEPDADMHFAWQPHYFTGLDHDGKPQFSERELDARPLDLDAATAGDQPEEVRDIVGQMGISWVPSLARFVMFYGGDASPMFANPIFGDDIDKVRRDPEGSLFVRFAEQPWGPWTAPRPFMAAGHWSSDAEPVEQYAPGGILAHNNCQGDTCARFDPAYRLDPGNNNNGVLYGANIVDDWTSAHDGQTDLYWFVSTWNPYQVVLMKTSLSY